MKTNLLLSFVLLAATGIVVYSQEKHQGSTFEDVSKTTGNVKYEFAKLNSTTVGYGREIVKSTNGDFDQAIKISGLLAPALSEIASDKTESANFSASELRQYFAGHADARSAAQISQIANEANVELNSLIVVQNSQLIDQNKKVIALLEKIAAKK